MGNRAVITTQENFESGKGLGVYLHWNGGRDSVGPFLRYCKLRSFRRPENDDYGWARLCQIIANFLGGEGLSIGIGDVSRLDTNNYDNGTYLIRNWEIVGRRYFEGTEQYVHGLTEILYAIDESQPEDQMLGKEMIDDLLHHGRTISDVSWNYSYEMEKRKKEGKNVGGFQVGRTYTYNQKDPRAYAVVKDVCDKHIVLEIDGQEGEYPRFRWKDGCESTIIKDLGGHEHPIDSSMEVVA